MANIPASVRDAQLALNGQVLRIYLEALGWIFIHAGKVRDSYTHPKLPDRRLLVATNRVSIFDFVLNALVEDKGAILTAVSHHNSRYLERTVPGFKHHMLPITEALPYLGDSCPLTQCTWVQEYEVQPYELIARARLGGSVWKEYERNWENGWSSIAGHSIVGGLLKWSLVPNTIESGILFTPSTKAQSGHDANIPQDKYLAATGEVGRRTKGSFITAFKSLRAFFHTRGLELYDAKAEYDVTGETMVDACFGFDEIRSGYLADAEAAVREGREPIFYDKEQIRLWGRQIQTPFPDDDVFCDVINLAKLDPENPNHQDFVESLVVPPELLTQTSERYHELFRVVTGKALADYQCNEMGIFRAAA